MNMRDELLAALKEATDEFEEASQYKGDYLRKKHGDGETIAQLRAIIAKATESQS